MKEEVFSQTREKKIIQVKQSLHDLIYTSDTKKTGEFCQKLKSGDIDILNSYDNAGMTPLHIAIKNQDVELVELLLEYGADPNKRDIHENTPIVRAVECNNPKIILLLLEEGADLKKTDASNQAILKIANDKKSEQCIEILRDYGAFFVVSKKTISEDSSYSGVDSFIKEISAAIFNIVDEATASVSFNSFYEFIQERTQSLFSNNTIDLSSARNKINQVFDHVLFISTTKIFDKTDSLKATRRVINILSQILDLSKNNKNAILILSKLENVVEDDIVHARTSCGIQGSKKQEIGLEKKVFSEDKKLHLDNQDLSRNSELSNKIISKIISKNISHDVDLINFVKIAPHHLQNKSQIENLVALSEYRLKVQNSFLAQGDKNDNNFQDIISQILNKSPKEVLMSDAITIDKILRVGKEEQIHILSLSMNAYSCIETDLERIAVELGANVYTIEYPKNPKHKFDLIYAGIAAVNKLLDDSIHPDKIFIHSDGASYKLVKFVVAQFAKRGIALSEIIIAGSEFDGTLIENNSRCLLICPQMNKIKQFGKYEGIFKEFSKHLSKVFKNNMTNRLHLSTELSKNYSVMQLIALFIKSNQLFLKENLKLRNPNLPSDKVDNIIGVLPDEV